jgi:hypothetical protein
MRKALPLSLVATIAYIQLVAGELLTFRCSPMPVHAAAALSLDRHISVQNQA